MIQRLALMLMIVLTFTACNRDNFSVRSDGEGSTIVTISLTEAEFNTLLTTAIANSDNPLLRDPSVDFQNGQIVVSGEHDRRDGSGRVAGTMNLSVGVVDGVLNAQITDANIEGLDLTDERIAELNARLAEALAGRAVQDNPLATLNSIHITDNALQIDIRISRNRG